MAKPLASVSRIIGFAAEHKRERMKKLNCLSIEREENL